MDSLLRRIAVAAAVVVAAANPVLVDPASAAAPFNAGGSVNQVYVTGLTPGQDVELNDHDGDLVDAGTADSAGAYLFRKVEAAFKAMAGDEFADMNIWWEWQLPGRTIGQGRKPDPIGWVKFNAVGVYPLDWGPRFHGGEERDNEPGWVDRYAQSVLERMRHEQTRIRARAAEANAKKE